LETQAGQDIYNIGKKRMLPRNNQISISKQEVIALEAEI